MRGIGRYDGRLFPATSAPLSSSLLPVTDLHAQPAAPTQHRHSPLARAGLGWFVLLVVYASLYPFAGWTDTGVSPFAFLSAPLPRYNTAFDMLTNVWGYMPLGMLTVLALHPRITGWRAVLLALLAGLLLSGAMEAIQTYLPTRVSSNVDLATNTLGALLGGLVMLPFAARLIDRGGLRRLRRRWFEPHATFAILLMLVWPFAQIFPQEFLFSMGGVIRSILLDPSPDAFVVNLVNGWFPELFDWQDKLTAHPEALQRQELLEALQNKSGDSVRDLFEIYDKLRTMEPMETGMVINFPSEYPAYDESAYNFQLQSDYLNATNVETFGAAAAGPVNIPFGGIGEDVLDFGGDTVISGAEGVDTITFNTDEKGEDNDTISLG